MDITYIMEVFKDPNTIHTLSMGEKMSATLFVTILGMGITFTALVFIWGCIAVMSRALKNYDNKATAPQAAKKAAPAPTPVVEAAAVEEAEDEELIAVISAAVAASLNTSVHNIIVRNIVPVQDTTPSWGRAGRMEQMNTRF